MLEFKSFKICYVFVLIFFLISCNKSLNNEDVFTEKLSEFFNSKNISDQKIIYKLLTPEEKKLVWEKHFESFIASYDLSSDQRNALDSAKAMLTPAFFSAGSSECQIFKDKLEPYYRFKFKDLFGDAIAKSLLSNVTIYHRTGVTPNYNAPPEPPVSGGCGCSSASDWCSCPASLSPYHCPYCKATTACTSSSSGCGTLWSYSCDGTCITAYNE